MCVCFGIIALTFVILLFFFPFLEIIGSSMFPTLRDGDLYLGRRFFPFFETPKEGNIYVVKLRENYGDIRLIIKRLDHINEEKGCYFLGDNSEMSYDSREFGYVSKYQIVAKVMRKIM